MIDLVNPSEAELGTPSHATIDFDLTWTAQERQQLPGLNVEHLPRSILTPGHE